MDPTRFPVVEISGAPFEMGRRYGAGWGELIRESLAVHRRLTAGMGVDAGAQVAALARDSLPHAEAYAPDLVEEMRGIAAGADLPFEEIFELNASLDARGIVAVRQRVASGRLVGGPAAAGAVGPADQIGCSTYALRPSATTDGAAYLGWNADDSTWWLPACVVIRGRPDDAPAFLSWTFAGFIGRPGMNAHLGLAANGVAAIDGGPGVPYPLLCRRALAQSSTEDAIAAIAGARRMYGMNYMVADDRGSIASLEVSGERHAVVGAQSAWVCHTNHFVDGTLVPLGGRSDGPAEPNSPLRLARWYELMGSRASVGRDDLEAMHRDHRYAPDAICRHATRAGDGMTLASMIVSPGAPEMWVAYGHPCEHPFLGYALV